MKRYGHEKQVICPSLHPKAPTDHPRATLGPLYGRTAWTPPRPRRRARSVIGWASACLALAGDSRRGWLAQPRLRCPAAGGTRQTDPFTRAPRLAMRETLNRAPRLAMRETLNRAPRLAMRETFTRAPPRHEGDGLGRTLCRASAACLPARPCPLGARVLALARRELSPREGRRRMSRRRGGRAAGASARLRGQMHPATEK